MPGINLNVTESINSFIRPLGVRLSSPEQILAKVTMVAVAAILVVGNLPSASAYDCTPLVTCLNNCPTGRMNDCARQCIRTCCAVAACARECVRAGSC
ncbi:MAG: hypothetical protein ACRDAI_00620 [Candidatus Rhabdochlamydia sp.]